MQRRDDEARDIVFRLHRMPDDPDQEFARAEFYQMSKQAEIDRTLDPGWVRNVTSRRGTNTNTNFSQMEMWRRPSYRRRILMGCGFAFIGQSTGTVTIPI